MMFDNEKINENIIFVALIKNFLSSCVNHHYEYKTVVRQSIVYVIILVQICWFIIRFLFN